MRREVVLAIAGMAFVTYLTRAGGLWVGRGPLRERVAAGPLARWLAHLPGAVLVSILAPLVARGGASDVAAAAVALAVAARTRSAAATVVVGVLAAAGFRRLLAP